MDAKKIRQAEKAMLPFPQRLGLLLRQKGITQDELARVLGKSRQSVSQYCNGAEPDFPSLVKIADYLGVTADYLVGREDAPSHEAASIMVQTGLSKEAVASLAYNKAISESNPFRTETITVFLSDLICSNFLTGISSSYLLWKDATKELQAEFNNSQTDPSCVIDPFDSELSLEDAKKMIGEGLKHIKEGMAIEGARYGVVRMFENFLTEQDESWESDETEGDNGKGEE